MKVIISNNAENMRAETPTHTVECEYGSVVIEGRHITLAHHTGAYKVQDPPCVGDNILPCPLGCFTGNTCDEAIRSGYCPEPYQACLEKNWVIGISHFDLDTLGGIMRILGLKSTYNNSFWELAGAIDVKGIHKMEEILALPELGMIKDQLNAFWAWSESNRLFAPRDGSVMDCTDFIWGAIDVLNNRIFNYDPELLQAGREWAAAKEALDTDSFVGEHEGVILRKSEQFVNHLYRTAKAVVTYNPKTKAVTLSLADPIEGVNCSELAKELWGELAGGHAGIAGSPRGQEMTETDAVNCRIRLTKAINN